MSFHPETENYKYWTQQEELLLESLVKSGKHSFRDIGAKLNRSGQSCQDHSVILGFKSTFILKKYSVNENFWEVPNTINCYWAGFSAADASIAERGKFKQHFTYRLELQKSEKIHLENFIKEINFTGKLSETIRPLRNTHCYSFQVHSDKWAKDLKNNFGIIPRKVNVIMPPSITDEELLFRWLVGYTDGDGSIVAGQNRKIPYLQYVSCNEKLICWIKQYFDNFGDQLRKRRSKVTNYKNKYYKFSIGGFKAAQFIDKVNSSKIYCLDRKWRNPVIIQLVDAYKLKFPHLFLNSGPSLGENIHKSSPQL